MQKRLRPSLRENKRYLLIQTPQRDRVEKAILEFIGTLGYGQAGIKFIRDENTEKREMTILAVNREVIDKIRAALMLKNIKILNVSGTLKGLLER
jgi:RNase P/RNase MRP subunit POP5